MNHEDYKEWLQLSIAGELTNEEDKLLRAHLADCEECRAEHEELQQLLSHLGKSGAREPSERLLWEARQDLLDAMREESLTESVLTRLTQGVAPSVSGSRGGPRSTYSPGFVHGGWMGWFRGFRLALSGAAAIAVGILVGYLAFGKGVAPQAVSPFEGGMVDGEIGGPDIANVRFVDWDTRGGQIELQYDLIRPVRLRTRVEDDRVQRVLAHALLTDDNPGVRLKAINALDVGATREHGEDVKLALINSLKGDPNAGVRREALRALQDLPFDDGIKDACLYVLANDENPGMRLASINLLSGARLAGYPVGQDVYDFVNKTLEEKDDPLLRARSTAFIEEVQDE
jgi:hypothetical protein